MISSSEEIWSTYSCQTQKKEWEIAYYKLDSYIICDECTDDYCWEIYYATDGTCIRMSTWVYNITCSISGIFYDCTLVLRDYIKNYLSEIQWPDCTCLGSCLSTYCLDTFACDMACRTICKTIVARNGLKARNARN